MSKILTYHVVPKNLDSKAIAALIKEGGGKAILKTVAGPEITLSMKGSVLQIKDEKGGVASVSIANVHQKNGVIHVIDSVLLPK